LAPSEMAAALPRLELAAEGPRDVPERQRTLRATLDWSHALLTDRERELFAGLGVFVGGCDAEAAFAVCDAREPELDTLAEESLLEHSGARFAMLETVREYALERLGDSGLSDELCERHAEHYTELAELAEPELTADRRGSWLLRLEAEHPNFRAALTWCERSGAIALELRLVAALGRFWVVRGHLREGRSWIDGVLGRAGDAPPELRAKGLAAGASVTFWQGDYEGLKAFAREGIALCEQVGDKRGMAQALDRLGTAIANEGDHAGSMELYERSLALCREIDDVRMLAISTTNVGCLAMMQGDYERAEVLSREGLELHERAGQRDGMQQPLFNLGLIALLTGRADEALAIFDDGLAQAEELGFRAGTFYVIEGQAAAHAARGEHERAAARLGAAAAAAERAGGAQLEPFEQELHDRTVKTVRAALGAAAYEAAFAAGAADVVVTPS
jgi:tetratricopeptide (TPR) repeat protein